MCLLDFISVMIDNKREDNFKIDSQIQFSHNYILKFLNTHKKFVFNDQVIKILILARRFRLSLQFMDDEKIPFNIEFFTNAIESNSYDIAFYLLKVFDEEINLNGQKAIDTHVKSYEINR